MLRIVLLSAVLSGSGALALEGKHSHHLAIFAGPGIEEKKDHDEDTFAVGLEYGYRFTEWFGAGVVYETLGKDTVRNEAVVLPLSIYPGKGWRIYAGPGYEWHDKKEKYLIRAGAGYEFELSEQWSIGPEVYIDLIENGDRTWIIGLAFGFHF